MLQNILFSDIFIWSFFLSKRLKRYVANLASKEPKISIMQNWFPLTTIND